MNMLNFLDGFIPDELKRNMVSHSKARIIIGMTLLLSTIILINSIRGFTQGTPILGMVVAVAGILFLFSIFILKKTSSLPIAGNYVLALYLIMLMYVVFDSGIKSLVISAFVPFVFTAFLLTSFKTGLVWGFLTLGYVTVLKIMEMNGYAFQELAADQTYYINSFANLVNATILGSIFAFSSAGNLAKASTLQKEAEKSAEGQKQLIDEANSVMGAVSKGDLTKRISVDLEGDLGQLKTSVNQAMSILSQTMSKVITSSTQIAAGTNQLTSAAQSLASGTTEQAASIEEISSSMAEIGSSAKINNDNAVQAQTLSTQSTNDIGRGNSQMEAMLTSMGEINDTSTNVSKVIKVIDEIAFQTNLLALNAAVEAARAGKYGKGFAVVAEEVRNLAARSAEAAKDTTGLIETSIKEVENGVQNADQTAEILKDFVSSIEKVNDLVKEISIASQEQVSSVDEINTSLGQVNQVIQSNSSISEETAASAQELAGQAKALQTLMQNFSIEGNASVQPQAAREIQPEPVYRAPEPVALVEDKTSGYHDNKPSGGAAPQGKIILDDDDFGKY